MRQPENTAAITENEGKNAADITLVIENKDKANNVTSDIEDMFK